LFAGWFGWLVGFVGSLVRPIVEDGTVDTMEQMEKGMDGLKTEKLGEFMLVGRRVREREVEREGGSSLDLFGTKHNCDVFFWKGV
jgi:hypothetical protein